jgi:thioredoxin reductase (NADPH)
MAAGVGEPGCVGLYLTGPDIAEHWTQERPPLLETSMPGLFAVGDVRYGSVKRVMSAVGEGSIAIRMVHDYLATVLTEARR